LYGFIVHLYFFLLKFIILKLFPYLKFFVHFSGGGGGYGGGYSQSSASAQASSGSW